MIKISRTKEKELCIAIDLDWDKEKEDWVDEVYVSITNSSAHLYFSKEAEEKLKYLLMEEEKPPQNLKFGDDIDPQKNLIFKNQK